MKKAFSSYFSPQASVAALAVAAVVAWFLFHQWGAGSVTQKPTSTQPASPIPLASTTQASAIQTLLEETTSKLSQLAQHPSPENARLASDILSGLLAKIWRMPPAELATSVRAFLEGGKDANTQLPFAVSEDGLLETAPTLRVTMLDYLSRIAPSEAADLAATLLPSNISQDEWAVCLRCVASQMDSEAGDTASAAFLIQQVDRRLQQSDWLAKPSEGFLSAFDATTVLNDPQLYQTLGHLMDNAAASPAAKAAALLALQESAQNHPYDLPALLLDRPQMVANHPTIRGTILAAADVRGPAMQSALLEYFQLSDFSTPEMQAFLGQFPRTQWYSGVRLLSSATEPAIPGEELSLQYAGAVEVLSQLKSSLPDLPPAISTQLSAQLALTQERLAHSEAANSP